MLHQDWFMRQVRQLTKALEQVLAQQQQEQVDAAQQTILRALGAVEGQDRLNLRQRSLPETLQFCRRDGAFRPEFAMRVADLLEEEGNLLVKQDNVAQAEESYARALLLYRQAMATTDSAMPLDLQSTVHRLEAKLGAEQTNRINHLLNGRA
jgi:hypothetical protein